MLPRCWKSLAASLADDWGFVGASDQFELHSGIVSRIFRVFGWNEVESDDLFYLHPAVRVCANTLFYKFMLKKLRSGILMKVSAV
tara:strand:+ start:432 stop:686 length:255 start_codon:yes stop_codon:yes gene_type:complete